MMKLLTRKGLLVEEQGQTYMADDGDSDEARVLRPLQAAACTYRIAFGPRAGQKVLTVQGTMGAGAQTQAAPHPLGFRVTSLREPPAQAAPPAECASTCAHHRPARL